MTTEHQIRADIEKAIKGARLALVAFSTPTSDGAFTWTHIGAPDVPTLELLEMAIASLRALAVRAREAGDMKAVGLLAACVDAIVEATGVDTDMVNIPRPS